jgi:hypothetical protein
MECDIPRASAKARSRSLRSALLRRILLAPKRIYKTNKHNVMMWTHEVKGALVIILADDEIEASAKIRRW